MTTMDDIGFGPDFDWDEAIKGAKQGFEPLPPTTYDVVVKNAEGKQASTGSPMVKITLEVTSGPYAGRLVWTNLVVKPGSPDSARIFAAKCMAFGLTAEWLSASKPTFAQTAAALIGKRATVEVTQRDYNGRITNDVKNIKPSLGGSGVPSGVPGPPTPNLPTSAGGNGVSDAPKPVLPPETAPGRDVPSTPPLPPTWGEGSGTSDVDDSEEPF